MKPQVRRTNKWSLDVWSVARCYLRDEACLLLPEHVSFIDGLIRARDHARMAALRDVLGFAYLKPEPFYVIYQLEAMFKKNSFFSDDAVCTAAARKSFELAEEMCKVTNNRLVNFWTQECLDASACDKDLLKFVRRMRNIIGRILGPRKGFGERLPELVRFTSGASSTRTRRLSQPYRKVRKGLAVTRSAVPLLHNYLLWVGSDPSRWKCNITSANKIALVPKSWKTHRTIAAEPEGNLFFQLAVDSYIKDRLRPWGIDLSSQERNQLLAYVGSKTNALATVDLSMASDTVARELVPFLFPDEWASLLETLRTPCYTGVFGDGVYEKFSSMGNGFTFTVETVVFFAAALAVGSWCEVTTVYGDDIVCESRFYPDLVRLLNFLGFVPNTEKSFPKGPFRESCGADYLNGVNVRPVFIKESGELGKAMVCHYVNVLASIARPEGLLASYLRAVQHDARLPIVPVSDDTMTGVHVDVHSAYTAGVLRRRRHHGNDYQSLCYRGYVSRERRRAHHSIKTYLLWFLNARVASQEARVTSSVGTSEYKITSEVRLWNPPQTRPSVHLYWWSEYLLGRKP